jgi:hypothetical protein
VARCYALLRKKPTPQYRQKLLLGLLPVPGTEARNPPVNHHSVDLPAIRRKMELNRSSIQAGHVLFPGLGVSKHPMTIVTTVATYVIGWASGGGTRSISIVGELPMPAGRILFLEMGEPMIFTGPGEIVCTTPPVIFIGRRIYNHVGASSAEIRRMDIEDFQSERDLASVGVFSVAQSNSVDSFEAVDRRGGSRIAVRA